VKGENEQATIKVSFKDLKKIRGNMEKENIVCVWEDIEMKMTVGSFLEMFEMTIPPKPVEAVSAPKSDDDSASKPEDVSASAPKPVEAISKPVETPVSKPVEAISKPVEAVPAPKPASAFKPVEDKVKNNTPSTDNWGDAPLDESVPIFSPAPVLPKSATWASMEQKKSSTPSEIDLSIVAFPPLNGTTTPDNKGTTTPVNKGTTTPVNKGTTTPVNPQQFPMSHLQPLGNGLFFDWERNSYVFVPPSDKMPFHPHQMPFHPHQMPPHQMPFHPHQMSFPHQMPFDLHQMPFHPHQMPFHPHHQMPFSPQTGSQEKTFIPYKECHFEGYCRGKICKDYYGMCPVGINECTFLHSKKNETVCKYDSDKKCLNHLPTLFLEGKLPFEKSLLNSTVFDPTEHVSICCMQHPIMDAAKKDAVERKKIRIQQKIRDNTSEKTSDKTPEKTSDKAPKKTAEKTSDKNLSSTANKFEGLVVED
jgi:hypothetical protein